MFLFDLTVETSTLRTYYDYGTGIKYVNVSGFYAFRVTHC